MEFLTTRDAGIIGSHVGDSLLEYSPSVIGLDGFCGPRVRWSNMASVLSYGNSELIEVGI